MPERSVTMTNTAANAMHKAPGEEDNTRSFGPQARCDSRAVFLAY
jgi:hypothetical protein